MPAVMPGTTSKGMPASCRRGSFLAAPAEDEGVAAFQPHDPLAPACVLDDELVDLVLRQRVLGRPLAHVDQLSVRGCMGEQAGVDQPIVEDHLRLRQAQAPDADQIRVARARSHQEDAWRR